MKAKDLKIETVKQMIEVANEENIETLLADFSMFMRMKVEMKKALGDALVSSEFIWTDDGESGCRGMKIEVLATPKEGD